MVDPVSATAAYGNDIAAGADRPLAVFDLDGTLTDADTFIPFLLRHAMRRRYWLLPIFAFYIALYAARLISDRTAKDRILTAFLKGEPDERITRQAEAFCDRWLGRHLRPEVVERLRGHLRAGDRVILVSASPDVYVRAIARRLGIPEVIATRVESADGVCLGRIDGANCKGVNKVRLLRDYLGRDRPTLPAYAYGDSRHDLPLLRWVSDGYLVCQQGLVQTTPDC